MNQPFDAEALYVTRVLVFVETEPQSNEYHQLYLNKDEFKRLTASFGKVVGKKGHIETIEMRYSEETYKLPDLQDIHDTDS